MRLLDKVRAYKALDEMMEEEWDFDFIYPLTKLMLALAPDYRFFCREEMKLVAKWGKKGENGGVAIAADGSFDFADADHREGYEREHRRLENIASEGELSPLLPPLPQRIRGKWLKALLPFCRFEAESAAGGGERHGKTA
ncbi:MAG: hypothetical protein ACOX8R_05215 [Bacillota bacterium]|jgi:hypothetical protein